MNLRLRLIALLATLAAAAAPAEAQSSRRIEADTILSPHGCGGLSLAERQLRRCGFGGIALSPAGDRVLTVGTGDWVQLWTRNGRLLASVQAPDRSIYTPTGSALFVGGAAVALTGHATMVVLDAVSGATRLEIRHDMIFPRLVAAAGEHHVLIEREPPELGGRIVTIVDVRDGRIVREQEMSTPVFRPALRWAAGVSGRQVGEREWRATLHLMNPALEPIALERPCEALGPRPMCAARDVGDSFVHLFDPLGRRWSSFDLGTPLTDRTDVRWLQAGDRLFAIVCGEADLENAMIRACRIVDVETARNIYVFQAPSYGAAMGIDAHGTPEIRLAETPTNLARGTDIKRISVDGRVSIAGHVGRYGHFSLSLPNGDMLLQDGRDRSRSILVKPDGRIRARLRLSAQACEQVNQNMLSPHCILSSDHRTLAIMGGQVRLFALPAD